MMLDKYSGAAVVCRRRFGNAATLTRSEDGRCAIIHKPFVSGTNSTLSCTRSAATPCPIR